MRRKIVTMAVVGVLLALLGTLEQLSVTRLTDDALEQTRGILEALRAGDLSTAMEKARALDQMWDERASKLEMMIDHGSTDDVRFALSRLIASLEGEDRASALIYASELEGGIEHVFDRQEISPQNVL
ncbi:MAG: DUF4363 family protein [Clostridia bacterium]|nr:DUF4363 family protein [Clostridia bacterium]